MAEDGKLTSAEREQLQQKRIQARIAKASERGSRVLLPKTPLTHKVVDMAGQLDLAFGNVAMNAGMPGGPSIEEYSKVRDQVSALLDQLNKVTAEACRVAKFKYRVPRDMENPLRNATGEENEQAGTAADGSEETEKPGKKSRAA